MVIKTSLLKINPDAKNIVRGSDIDTCEKEWLGK